MAGSRLSAVVGANVGALALLPPAIQLGSLAAGAASYWFPWLLLLVPPGAYELTSKLAYGAVLGSTAAAVMSVGAGAGALLGGALSPLWQRISWRPSWRAARIAVLLAVLGGALVYADRRIGLPWPEATPPASSPWLEREKSLFRDVLAAQRYDMLVLPIQADDPSFDRVARSLMTRYLSLRTEERTGTALPDPTLLARALGVRERRLELEDSQRLASSLGASRMVVSTVKRAGATYGIQAALWSRAGGSWKESGVAKLDKLAYSDRQPPSLAFRDAVDALLDQLGVAAAPAATSQAGAAEAQPALASLRELAVHEGGSPVERAQRLQIMAALHERESFDAEALWERSLVALWRAPGGSELERVLEARAYMHLYRRPYAIERLGTPASPAGRALTAALNGDVPELERAAAAIEDRGQRLIAEIELADLYTFFHLPKRLVERRKQLLEPAWTEPALLSYRLSAPEWFRSDLHEALAIEVAKTTPVEFSLPHTARAWLRWLYFLDDFPGYHHLALAHALERSYRPLWEQKRAQWPARRAADRLAEWDYYDLLFAANRQLLLKTVYSTLYMQGLPARATMMIDSLGALFAGYPRLMYFEAWALDRLGRDSPTGAQKRLFSRSSALALSAYRWEGGETHLAAAVEYYLYERPYQKYLDEPLRWHRAQPPGERLQFERLRFSAQEIEREIAAARRRLEYSDHNAQPLTDLVRWLRRAGRVDEALSVVAANRQRFVGSVARAELLTQAAESAPGRMDPLPAYREMLEFDPDSWPARARLARAQMEAGAPAAAQKTYLEFPGFARPDGHNAVELAGHAFEAAYYFYRRGETGLARPLFVRAMQPTTGAAVDMRSRETLAVLDSDLRTALANAGRQVQRYGNSYAGMRQVLYLSVLGNREQAEQLFSDYSNRFGDEAVWMAAFVAHRMQRLEGAALEAWLAQAAARDTRRDFLTGALRERHAFMLAHMDRPVSKEALAQVQRVTAANNRSPFYPQLAEGYGAWRRGEFALAAQKLRGPHDDLYNISVNRRQSLSEWLPYLVLAYERAGRPAESAKLLGEHLANIGADSDYLIARALMEGGAGRHESAAASLKLAFHRLPFTQTRALTTGYSLLECAELLYVETRQEVYRALIEDVARRLQVDLPYPWAAAFEAKYARDTDVRQLALAAASILDPSSERIAQVPQAQREALRGAALRHDSVLGAALRSAQR